MGHRGHKAKAMALTLSLGQRQQASSKQGSQPVAMCYFPLHQRAQKASLPGQEQAQNWRALRGGMAYLHVVVVHYRTAPVAASSDELDLGFAEGKRMEGLWQNIKL